MENNPLAKAGTERFQAALCAYSKPHVVVILRQYGDYKRR
jgi:hypothetical protein